MSQAVAGFPWFILGVLVIGFVPGVCLLIVGRRGRRIDDHPVCRGCGFDLVGTVEPIPDKYPKCPECGTRREPRLGNRQRRGNLIVAGVVLMFLSVGVGGVWGYGRFDAAHVAQYKPIWLLRWEARSSSSHQAEIAIHEIFERHRAGQINKTLAGELMDDVVSYGPAGNPALEQSAVGYYWDVLAAELMRNGVGTPSQRVSVGRSWLETEVEIRPQVRLGQPIPIRFQQYELGPSNYFGFFKHLDNPTVRLNGRAYLLSVSKTTSLGWDRILGWLNKEPINTLLSPVDGLPADLDLGVHQLVVEIPVRITDGQNGPVLAQWTESHPVRFEYVGADGDPIELINFPAMAEEVKRAVAMQDRRLTVNRQNVHAILDWPSIPANVAYQIYFRRGERKWRVYTAASSMRSGTQGFDISGPVPDEWPDGTRVDVIFEPSPDVARQTPNLTAILDYRFVIENVEIFRSNSP